MSGNIIQPGWTAFYARQQHARKQADTFDADLAELRQITDRLIHTLTTTGDIDFTRTLLAAHNIGRGITVQA